MRTFRSVSANDPLSDMKKQISKTLEELDDSKCFELPRSLSMDRLSLKKPSVSSESVATVLNGSKSMTDLSHNIKHVSNPTSIFTPDPFSKVATTSEGSQTVDDQKDCVVSREFSSQTITKDKNTQASLTKMCIQADQESQTKSHDSKSPSNMMAVMQESIDSLESEILLISRAKAPESVPFAKETKNPDLELKLRKAEMEIKSLNEQNRIISAENQKLIVNTVIKRENVTKEREVMYEFIHDFMNNETINDHSLAKSLVDQMSKKLYSLIEHSSDVSQLDRMKDLFLSFREAVVQIVNESIHLDHRISNLASSSDAIRIESETIISQLEEKSKALLKENQDLQKKIQDIRSEKTEECNNRIDNHLKKYPDSVVKNNNSNCHEECLNQENSDNRIQDQETIKILKSENEGLKMQLLSLNKETSSYPLSDLYEKIVALLNRDASSGINIKEILEWIEEKRVVIEELEKLRTSHSNLLYKHKHLVKEYSDQKSVMDEIQKRITVKEAEWQSKFKEFASNANQLEARYSSLQSILCDYAIQFQGVLSFSSDASAPCTSDHPLPFLKHFGNLQKNNSSLDHSLQHASSALSESQRATNHALQNLDAKHSQIVNLEREKQEIATLISKFKSEISAKDKEIVAVKSVNQQLQDRNLKLSDKLKRIADAFKWTML